MGDVHLMFLQSKGNCSLEWIINYTNDPLKFWDQRPIVEFELLRLWSDLSYMKNLKHVGADVFQSSL